VPAIRMGVVVVVVVVSAIVVAGCRSGATAAADHQPPGSSVPARQHGSTTAPSTPSTLTVPIGGADQYAGLAATDWASIDQALSYAQSALAQSDADASHNEQGDATP
jgi:hypothetical protein